MYIYIYIMDSLFLLQEYGGIPCRQCMATRHATLRSSCTRNSNSFVCRCRKPPRSSNGWLAIWRRKGRSKTCACRSANVRNWRHWLYNPWMDRVTDQWSLHLYNEQHQKVYRFFPFIHRWRKNHIGRCTKGPWFQGVNQVMPVEHWLMTTS